MKIPQEFIDALEEVEKFGETKYGAGDGEPNWIHPNAPKTDHLSMHDSIFHHLAQSFSNVEKDHESGLHPAQHAAYRLMMLLTRMRRGIVHDKDAK